MGIVAEIAMLVLLVSIAYTIGYFSGMLPHAIINCIKVYHGKKDADSLITVCMVFLSVMAVICSIAYMADKSIRQSPVLIFFWFMGFIQPVFYLIAGFLERGNRKNKENKEL